MQRRVWIVRRVAVGRRETGLWIWALKLVCLMLLFGKLRFRYDRGCQKLVESCQNIEMSCLSALPGGKTLTRAAGSKPGPCGLISEERRLIMYMNTGQRPNRLMMYST